MSVYNYFLDTNIFLRSTVNDVPHTAIDCKALVLAISTGQVSATTSSLVLAEVAWVLHSVYKLNKANILEVLQSIVSIRNLVIEDKVQHGLAVEYFTVHNIKFVDCMIASHPDITSRDMAVVSYDKDFDKLGVKRLEPREILGKRKRRAR